MDSWTTGNDIESSVEALASTDLMYLVYAMARTRPVIHDLFVVQRLKDTQRIKDLEMDAVLLQFWLAALTGLAESNSPNQRLIWKSLIFVKIFCVVEMSLRHLSFYRGILNECDECIAEDNNTNNNNNNNQSSIINFPTDTLKTIVTGCIAKGIVRATDLVLPNNFGSVNTMNNTIELVLADYDQPSTIEVIEDLCGRALTDFEHQEVLVDKILQVCSDASSGNDVSMLSKICLTLDDNPLVLDLIHLLKSPADLLGSLESYVNNLQQNEEDDIDTCNANLEGLGNVLILIMTIVRRYELAGCLDTVLKNRHGFCHLWLLRTSSTIPPMALSSMSAEMHALMGRWISALFDSMEIAPSIFEQSLAACHAGVIDSTTLTSGLDYFLQPCLLFVLIGVVQYLCEEIVFSSSGAQFMGGSSTSSTPAPQGGGSSGGGNGQHAQQQSILSPTAGRVISPLANRGGGGGGTAGGTVGKSTSQSSSTGLGTNSGSTGAATTGVTGTQGPERLSKSAALVMMLQSSLKSLLAGESFPFRLMRLLRSEISAALESMPQESNDHQMGLVQERLSEATINYYPWSSSESYEVNKLGQQTCQSFGSIIAGGRSSFVTRRLEKANININSNNSLPAPALMGSFNNSYHIDVDLIRASLTYLGPSQFVANIIEQLTAAANTPHGHRAGAAILTTPLRHGDGDHQHLSPQSLLWTLMYQALWVPVPGKLETFQQGKVLALFVGMTLDFFQSRTYLQRIIEASAERTRGLNSEQDGSPPSLVSDPMEVDTVTPVAAGVDVAVDGENTLTTTRRSMGGSKKDMTSSKRRSRSRNSSRRRVSTGHAVAGRTLQEIERDAAVEPFRMMLDQRLKLLSTIAQDRPGFEGFLQEMGKYQERQAPVLASSSSSSASNTNTSVNGIAIR
ncbi:mediator complex subunit [Podila humilis]|nr:mediator complex subunit [Podila humilis]